MLTTKLKEQTYQTRAFCPFLLLTLDVTTLLLLTSITLLVLLAYYIYRLRQKNAQLEQYNLDLNSAFLENCLFEKEVQDQLYLMELTMDNIPYYVFWKDAESRYLGCNRLFAEIAGLTNPEDIVGKSDFELAWDQKDASYYHQTDEIVMVTGEAIVNLEEYRSKDGQSLILRTNKIPLKDKDGTVIGIVGIFEDITTRNIIEEKLKRY